MIPAWKDAPVAIVTRDTVRLLEVTLRFPPDAPPGGLVRVAQWQGATPVSESGFALTPADVDALRTALAPSIRALLEARGLVAPTAVDVLVDPIRGAMPVEAPAPDMGRL